MLLPARFCLGMWWTTLHLAISVSCSFFLLTYLADAHFIWSQQWFYPWGERDGVLQLPKGKLSRASCVCTCSFVCAFAKAATLGVSFSFVRFGVCVFHLLAYTFMLRPVSASCKWCVNPSALPRWSWQAEKYYWLCQVVLFNPMCLLPVWCCITAQKRFLDLLASVGTLHSRSTRWCKFTTMVNSFQ